MRLLKTVLTFVTVSLFLTVATESITLAEGYNNPLLYSPGTTSTPEGPHGNYTTSTNKCKECHAVHMATGSYALTRASNASEACQFCHGVGGVASKKITLNAEGHGLSEEQKTSDVVTAPDDTTPAYTVSTIEWGCTQCHSVHNNNTVILKGSGFTESKLLRADPNPGKTYRYYNPALVSPITRETTQTASQWCSACHNANFGASNDPKQVMAGTSAMEVFGHAVSGSGYTTDTAGQIVTTPRDGVNNGPTCKQCHLATGIGGNFPHSSESTAEGLTHDMLKSGTKQNQLDSVCMSCHKTASLP